MCAACVAQGVLFAGSAAGGLRLMAAHAATRRADGRLPDLDRLGDGGAAGTDAPRAPDPSPNAP